VTTVAYVFKVTLNKFAAPKPIFREKIANMRIVHLLTITNMRILHLFRITNMRILHLFNEGDLNESYMSYNYSFYSKAVLKG
jgi:hypothetical protein